jgi:LPS export ABC transporter permease LptG/LPS export ABC transporter permease LptF
MVEGMIRAFDRYVIRELFPPFLVGLAIYTFVLLMNELLRAPELFIAKGVPLGTTLLLLFYLLPAVLSFTLPMSVLMGFLAGLGRLSSDSEVTAFRTLGISPTRMLRPLAIFALGGWLATSALTMFVAPQFNYRWAQTFSRAVLNRVDLQFSPREFNESLANITLYIENVRRDGSWSDVFVLFGDPPEEPRVVLARTGALRAYPEVKRAVLELRDVVQHSSRIDDPESSRVWTSSRIEEEINAEGLFSSYTAEKRIAEKSIRELDAGLALARERLPVLERDALDVERRDVRPEDWQRGESRLAVYDASQDIRSHRVEIQKKYALPFVCWIFVLLSLPLGASTRKGGRTSGFTLSILIILVYWVAFTAGINMALNGRVSPFLGLWSGNILLGAVSLVLFAAMVRERPLLDILFRGRRSRAGRAEARAGRRGRRWRIALAFPNILDRYLIRRWAFISSLIFASLVGVSVIVTIFDQIDNMYRHHKPFGLLMAFVWARIPEFIHFSLPVTALMAAVLTLGLFTKTNEITAMKSCGISVYRAIVPLALCSLLLGGLAFYMQENILPRANLRADEIRNRLNDAPVRSYGYETRRWVSNKTGDRFYNYTYYDPKTSTFSHLSIFDLDLGRWTLTRRIYAQKAALAGDTLKLEGGWVQEFAGGARVRYDEPKTFDLKLQPGEEIFLRETRDSAQMTYTELGRQIGDVAALGFDTVRLEVDQRSKISFPFVALVMTLVGVPFAFSMGKRGALVGIGVGLSVAVIYWVAIGIFRSLGYVSFLSPFLAAWGPNILFGLGGLTFLSRVRT